MYFAASGAHSWLMDLYANNTVKAYRNVSEVAKGDVFMLEDNAENTSLEDECFDFIFSVGLLEHIECGDLQNLFGDNYRILKPGGMFCHYVVPDKKSIQDMQPYKFINHALGLFRKKKPKIYRNNYGSKVYEIKANICRFKNVNSSWCMPIPLLSHSPSYPFSKLPGLMERIVVWWQKKLIRKHGWLCNQDVGQGFYVWGYK
jgi:SAM-dependent methyltransferase